MRILAIIGLVATLALIAWVIVQGTRLLPNAGGRMSAAVSSVTSVFRSAPRESLSIGLDARTLTSGAATELRFEYTGEQVPASYVFSYSCVEGVTLAVLTGAGARDLACATPLPFESDRASVQITSSKTRFTDITLTVTSGALKYDTLVTVVNTSLASSIATTTTPVATTTPSSAPTNVAPKPVVTTTPKAPVVSKPVSVPTKQPIDRPVSTVVVPADLVLNIEDTGILTKVGGSSTFFPVSPIPSNKTAAVTFTVTNAGGKQSGTWAFRAWLPIEGDSDYQYSSPIQASLKPGQQIEYTLGFDEVVRAKAGTIKIELVTTDKTDKAGNNIDAVRVDIKK